MANRAFEGAEIPAGGCAKRLYVVVESAKAQGQSFGNLGCDAGKEVATLITFESE